MALCYFQIATLYKSYEVTVDACLIVPLTASVKSQLSHAAIITSISKSYEF